MHEAKFNLLNFFIYAVSQAGLRYARGIVIREDSLFVAEDLFVTDINSSTAGYYGYRDKANAEIYFNIYSMDNLSANEKKSVAAHELGHALGLGHNTNNIKALMTGDHYFPINLHQDDKDSYDEAEKLY